MSSESTSQATQPSSVHASHETGGRRGSTPRPDTWQPILKTTAQWGTASDSPISRASPTAGAAEKQRKPDGPDSAAVMSAGASPTGCMPARANEHGTISSSRVVLNTIGSATSVRAVATWVSVRTITGCGCGADSQNVTSPRAAAGGRSSTPISSRNLT